MKKMKLPVFCLMLAVCLAMNCYGSILADSLRLPVWLDSAGTVITAYMAGPFCGAVVGATTNLLLHLYQGEGWIYALVSVWIGIAVGFVSRRKQGRLTLFEALTLSGGVSIGSTAIATPLNLLLNGGSTGNIWGDAVISFLTEQGFREVPSVLIGQLYVEMLDKVVVMLLVYLLILLASLVLRRKRGGDEPEDGAEHTAGDAARAAALLIAAGLCAGALAPGAARAEEKPGALSFTDYVQTIYASQNGLPCGEANDIAQTRDGILWIGTYAGLYRYNGRTFQWMDHFDSVRNVNCLYVDEEGRLWIGTNDSGLSIIINEQVTNVIDQDDGLPSNSVRAVIRSTDGYYYVGTTSSMQVMSLSNGLHRINTLPEIYYAERPGRRRSAAGPGGAGGRRDQRGHPVPARARPGAVLPAADERQDGVPELPLQRAGPAAGGHHRQ